ncbi:MAG: hypothetical protein ACRDKY_01385 [Solirubrobacteraceae bacterium]
MNVVSAADTHAIWQVVVGMGGVVLAVVIVLMMLLLSLIKDIRRNVDILLDAAPVLAKQTANLTKLAATPGVLDLIIEEAIVQDGYMDVLGAHYAAPGEVIA